MIEQVGEILMTDKYWDCECRNGYIHPSSDNVCTVCHALREEQPDSRVTEVLAQIGASEKTNDANVKVTIDSMCLIETPSRKQVLVKHQLPKVMNHRSGLFFPYGHIAAGESIVESTIREIRKETGLTVSHLNLCGVVEWQTLEKGVDSFLCEDTIIDLKYIVFMFRTSCYSGELKSSEKEHMEWMTLEEMQARDLAPYMKEYLQMIMDGNKAQAYGDGCNNVFKTIKKDYRKE